MPSDNPYQSPQTETAGPPEPPPGAHAGSQRPLGLIRGGVALAGECCIMFARRERILLRYYRRGTRALGGSLPESRLTVSEARRRYAEIAARREGWKLDELEKAFVEHERFVVLAARLCALWLLCWWILLPTAAVLFCVWLTWVPGESNVVNTVGWGGVGFVFLSFFGLFASAWFVRPMNSFLALLSRWLGATVEQDVLSGAETHRTDGHQHGMPDRR